MKYFIPLICLMLLCLTGCGGKRVNDTQVQGLDTARQNVEAVATALDAVSENANGAQKVVEASADILQSQVKTMATVLPPETLTEKQKGKSTVEIPKLISDPESAAKETIAKDDEQRKEIEASVGFFQKVKDWAGWGAIGGVAASLALAAQRIFLPAVSPWLSDPIIRNTPVVGKFFKKAEEGNQTIDKYKGLVGDSLVARTVLMQLDQKIDPEVKEQLLPILKELAGRDINGIDDLFKHTANANSVDRGANSETRELLNEVRDQIKTVNGIVVPSSGQS